MSKIFVGIGLAAATLTACEGSIDGSGSDGVSAPEGSVAPSGAAGSAGSSSSSLDADPSAAGPRPLQRLSRREYNNTVRDLLGDESNPAHDFADDQDRAFLFRRGGLVATQDAELLGAAAQALAAKAMASPSQVLPCAPESGEAACADAFIADFGLRAYRRPLAAAESQSLKALYEDARAAQQMTFEQAIQLLLEAMLQAPAFLYHWESPYAAPELEAGVVKLDGYDVASRLSYFIWGSMPDRALFDAAAAGELGTEAQVAEQAKRMLADAKARDAAGAFFREWLELDQLASLPKSEQEYPEYTDELRQAAAGETTAFVQNVLFEGDGKLETLLSADFSFSNQSLSSVYGGSAHGSALTRSLLDTTERRGLLTQPAFLALSGAPDGSHPIKRGKAVYVKLLCGALPPPPGNVPAAEPASAGGTTRERFAAHAENACAKGCHALMDPLGFAFEHYDGIGRYRTLDNGKPVDASGQFTIDGAEQSFADATELTQLLATSDTVRSCFAKQWFRFALSRPETEADAASLASISEAFAKNEFDVRDLGPAIVASRSFRYRSLAAGEPSP